jgi:hypothetical protein
MFILFCETLSLYEIFDYHKKFFLLNYFYERNFYKHYNYRTHVELEYKVGTTNVCAKL